MKLSLLMTSSAFFKAKKSLKNRFLALGIILLSFPGVSQQSITFNYTGGPQTWTVPACVTSISVTMGGAKGGGMGGGNGVLLTSTIPVTAGQVLQINVGGQGGCPLGGWNGGGNGVVGIGTNVSCGGGGSTDIRVAPYNLSNRIMVAGAGGGGPGANYLAPATGGGCASGAAGTTYFGGGGGGGTQFAGGSGGIAWGSGNAGFPGVLGQGGNGALDPCYNTSPGGGGGGGYYGGGGGGSDCFAAGNVGGGQGGGGSSLLGTSVSCTVAGNTTSANGYVTITTSSGVTASNAGPYCEGSTIQLNGSAGTTYSWTGPNGWTSNLQNPIIPNCTVANAGVYSLTVTGVGCLAASTTTVNVVPAITPSAGMDDTVCFGSPIPLFGQISVATDAKSWSYYAPTVSPAPAVSFSPASNNLTPIVSVTQPGTYNFILLESNPVCGIVRDTVVIFVKQMNIQTSFTNPICNGSADGTITVNGVAATESSFDGGSTWNPTLTGTGFTAGTYNVCVRDNNLCQACAQVTLTDPPPIIISLSNDTLVCQNGTATLVASASGGSGYVYNWAQFPGTTDTQYGQPIANTYYSVQAVSTDGCPSNLDSIYVTVRPPISGTISPNDTVCPGYSTMVTATAVDGIGAPFTFTWSDGTIGTGASNSHMVTPPVTTPYTVTITDGCESTPLVLSNSIVVSPIPVPTFVAPVTEYCEPAEFQLYVTTNPADFASASWFLSDGQFFSNLDTITSSPIDAGSYNVQLVLTNQFGCIDSVTYNGYLISHPDPISTFRFYPGVPTMFNTEVQFTNFSVNAVSYEWSFENGNPSASTLDEPTSTFPEGEAGFYDVQLIATSDFGCVDTVVQTVEVKPEVIIYAPNSFTPDGDEFNGTWRVHIVGIDIQEFTLEIRNRWGELIWESNDPEAEWDGTYAEKAVPQGTYNWFIRAKDLVTDEPYLFKGNITILK